MQIGNHSSFTLFQKGQPIRFCDHHVYLIGALGFIDDLAHILTPPSLVCIVLGDVEQSDLAVYAWSCNEAGVGERVADNHGRELCFVYVREEQRTGCCFYLWQVGFILHAIFLSKDFGHKKAHGLFRIHALFGCYSVVREFISLGRGRISGFHLSFYLCVF